MGKKLIIMAIIGLILGPILIVLGLGGAFLSLIADFVGLSLFGGEDAIGSTQKVCILVGIFMMPTGVLVFIGSGILLIASIVQQIRKAFKKKPAKAESDVEGARDVAPPKSKKGKGKSKKRSKGKGRFKKGSKGKKRRSVSKGKKGTGKSKSKKGKNKKKQPDLGEDEFSELDKLWDDKDN